MAYRGKRRFERRPFERMGALDIGDGSASAACEILDISEGGARLRPLMFPPDAVPDDFILLVTACGRVRRPCRVVWRSHSELGVRFAKS